MKLCNKYQTPVEVCKYMKNLLPKEVISVLEPTPGVGYLSNELISAGFNVTAPIDYFLLDKKLKFDAVVMNAPFSKNSLNIENAPPEYLKVKGMKAGYNILFECMQKAPIVVALVPWFTISDSDVRLRAIKKFGLKSVTLLPRRTFNYTTIQTCVIELHKNWNEPTVFNVYDLMVQNLEYKESKLFD